MNLFSSLEIGKRALNAQRTAITIAGHNIANINTPNFARQRAELAATLEGDIASGVNVDEVRQIRDKFLDARLRVQIQDFGKWESQSNMLSQVEDVLGTPHSNGVSNALSQFWDAWQDLGNQPESEAARVAVIERGENLAYHFNKVDAELKGTQVDINAQIEAKVQQINSVAETIGKLNAEITGIKATGENANDQMDSQAALIDELSTLVNVTTLREENGSAKVFIGGFCLVERDEVTQLDSTTFSGGHATFSRPVLPDGSAVNITSGELAGLMQLRDTTIPEFTDRIDQLAASLTTDVNSLHSAGYGLDNSTGLSLFSGASASDITVNSVVKNNPDKLATSSSINSEGNNEVALSISQLRYAQKFNNGTETYEDFYHATVGMVGVKSQEAQRLAENQQLLVERFEAQRDSVSSVSLDEEMSNLIRFQHAYEAAARFISVLDEMMETVIDFVR